MSSTEQLMKETYYSRTGLSCSKTHNCIHTDALNTAPEKLSPKSFFFFKKPLIKYLPTQYNLLFKIISKQIHSQNTSSPWCTGKKIHADVF